ncbi:MULTISPECIES: restriction endonuclease subunit S [unclassified Massilia]|uniref:restriction endonuclease subunit S n=1 Tax=unclassified Massilia TaxID=2609279 RepID=UPI00177D859B|nr:MULTISPECIES: restriction endonuclease subunit S [unclassified Massilia]MBD8529559.1 restriction endonuclease subunit S [Massilia sp. CFBP 13647]MBD8673354.1 restriction endonuclease subunit S [Massilia sp. CFBP 13721]
MIRYDQYPHRIPSKIDWLGDVPSHWNVIRIKHLTSVKRGASPRPIDDPKYFDDEGEFAWVRIADVSASERYLEATTQRLSEIGENLSVKRWPGDLFLSIAGTVGKPIITKIKCCIHDGFVYFPDFKERNEFLYYVFACGQPYLGLGKMGTQLNLNTDTVGSILIGLPPVDEQNAIVKFLDFKTAQIDALIAKQKTLLDKLAEKRAALISHAVTKGLDPSVPMKDSEVAWLGEIPVHWAPKRLRFCMKTNPSKGEIKLDDNELVSFVPMEAVGEFGGLNLDAEKELGDIGGGYTYFADNDVVVAKITPCFENGKGAIARGLKNGIAFGTTELHVMRVCDALLADYLFHLTMSHPFRCIGESEMYGAGGQKRVPETFLKDFCIGLPPTNEQHDIVEYINKLNKKLDSQMQKATDVISRLVEYRSTLITNAVTGKIDVRGFQIPHYALGIAA